MTPPESWNAAEDDWTTATLGYVDPAKLPPKGEKPFIIVFPISHVPGAKQQNLFFIQKPGVRIRNLRGREEQFNLDVHGFQPCRWSFDPSWVTSEEAVEEIYCREAERFLKGVLDAKDVVVFDWLVRKNTPHFEDRRFRKQLRPALNVHIDQTPRSAVNRVRFHMGSRAEELLKKRFQIINIWRPLFTPLEDWPLAVCDFRTTPKSCIIAADTVSRGEYKGESAYLKYDPAQEFWYLKHQTVDEVWLMKQFDSLSDATNDSSERVAQFAAHTAFDDPNAGKNARLRESIELRMLVFYD